MGYSARQIAAALERANACSSRQADVIIRTLEGTDPATAAGEISEALEQIRQRLDAHDQQIAKALTDAANGQVGRGKPGPKPKTAEGAS